MRKILFPLIILAAMGLFLSSIVHLAALIGFVPFGKYSWGLHVGAIIIWFPAVVAMMVNLKGQFFKLDWKEAFILNPFKHRFFKGCPKWMIILMSCLFIYGILNFAIFMGIEKRTGLESTDTAQMLRGFSGHWMIFYSAALSILYSSMWQIANNE